MTTMTALTQEQYEAVVNAIKSATGGSNYTWSYPWNALNNGTYTAKEFYDLMHTNGAQKAGYQAVLNADGSVRTYTYINKNGQIADLGSYDDIAGAFNSNYQTGTASGGTIQFTQATDTALTTATETAPSVVEAAGTMSKFANGVEGVGNFVFGSVLPAIGAAATGIALGKIIDKGIYEIGTNVFGSDKLEAFNPDTWGSITAGDDSFRAKAFNTIFGINPDTGNTQMYLDENAFAYLAAYLNSLGAFTESHTELIKPNDETGYFDFMPNSLKTFTLAASQKGDWYYYCRSTNNSLNVLLVTNDNYGYVYSCGEHEFTKIGDACPKSWFNNIEECYEYGKTHSGSISNVTKTHTYKGKTKYVNYGGYLSGRDADTYEYLPSNIINRVNLTHNQLDDDKIYDYLVGSSINEISTLNGINTQDGAKTPDLPSTQSIEDVLNALKSQYPELWNNRVENSVVQPDGTIKTYTYIPVPMPTGGTADQPTTEGAKQSKPEVDPSTVPDTLLNTLVQILTQTKPVGMTDTPTDPVNPNPTDTGGGDTPIVVVPTGSASALYSIYNPSQSQLNSFGAWLWSSDFVDQLLKLFNDPMQAIIGLHKVFAAPPISGAGTIKVGYLDSGVASNIVGNQYTTVDCGSVSLAEYFGNVFDYEPYTKVNLYLPFIGIVPLSVGEVMRSTIHIVYHVDVLTGACLAEVKITRDAAGGTLFQYSGNAAVQYPISSGSYMGIISGIMSIAGGVAGTIATGGAAMPVLLGAGASVGRMHTEISHSGSFSGNAGAMGIKKPYLIIDRPQTALAKNFSNYVGYPSNTTVKLSSCHGFTRCKSVHVEGLSATEEEKAMIETALKNGVIIN